MNQDPATNDTHSFSYSAYPMMAFDDTVTNPNNILAPITSMQKDSQNSNKNPDFQVKHCSEFVITMISMLRIDTQSKSNLPYKVCNME